MKILGGETNLNAPISVGSARVVRVFNSDSSNLLVTRKTSGGTTVGTFMVPAGKVVYCQKDYTDTLEGSVNLKVTQVAFSPMMSFALMSSEDPDPTYTHSVSATSVDEGGSFTTTITTTNVDDGTNLYWELTGVSSADFSSGALTGTASISSNSATFSHTVDEDLTTEGTETATIKVYSDSGRTTQVGNTLTVTISDTSTTPAPSDVSTEFDGNDAVIFPMNSSSLDWGASENVTLECWFKIHNFNSGTWHSQFGRWKGGEYCFLMEVNTNGGTFLAIGNGSGYYANMSGPSGAVIAGQWYHVACVKNGSNGTIYLNGMEDSTTSGWSQGCSNSTRDIVLGGNADGWSSYGIDGEVMDVRFTIGKALYTSEFSPPTEPLTTTSQGASGYVKFLGAQGSDITVATYINNGNASDTATLEGNPISSTESPFVGNYSVDFDGGSFLRSTDSADFDLDAVDFTVECWYYPRSNPSWVGLVGQWPVSGTSIENSWLLEPVGSQLNFYYQMVNSTYSNVAAPGTLQTNQWQHCAVVKKNGQLKCFLNGAGSNWITPAAGLKNTTSDLTIGGNVAPQYSSGWADGLISNVRITKGQCLYENNFTPSTSPLTTTSQGATASNVKLLCCQKAVVNMAEVTTNPITIGDNNFTTGVPEVSSSNPF